jgi:hypothetical protein
MKFIKFCKMNKEQNEIVNKCKLIIWEFYVIEVD